MSIKSFSHLKEIQSLDNMIKKHLDVIQEEEKRLDDINSLRGRRSQEKENLSETLNSLKTKSSQLEKELFDWEKRLTKANDQLPCATNEKEVSALEKEQNLSQEKVDSLQEEILNFLEEMEGLEAEIETIEGFLTGSLETVQEIKSEIDTETKSERQKIANYEERIESLRTQVPEALWPVFARARSKHRFNSSLARIINKGCEKCRFIIDSQTAARVENATGHEQCSQCERLLIPLES